MNKSRPILSELIDGIRKSDRIALARAITLVESTLPTDQEISAQLIDNLLPYSGNSVRIAITGVPGVGKSTFIEAFGRKITSLGKKIAVLTIDPSSQLSKGSILGDKTRMDELSKDKLAFIRPTSSGNTLGGVANRTRETIILCEAAGFEVIIIETVGVGQSEVAVRSMVDFFLLLMLAGAGDELQGIKKGIMEMADAVVITKADGDNLQKASEAKSEYQQALNLQQQRESGWNPKVLTCSALANRGIEDIWNVIDQYVQHTKAAGFFETQRHRQNISWFTDQFFNLLKNDFLRYPELQTKMTHLEKQIAANKISSNSAAMQLLMAYHNSIKG